MITFDDSFIWCSFVWHVAVCVLPAKHVTTIINNKSQSEYSFIIFYFKLHFLVAIILLINWANKNILLKNGCYNVRSQIMTLDDCCQCMLMHQSMWITRVPPIWADPRDSDIWKFLLSKSPPSFAPYVSECLLFHSPCGGNLFILNVRTAPGFEHHCQKAVRITWVPPHNSHCLVHNIDKKTSVSGRFSRLFSCFFFQGSLSAGPIRNVSESPGLTMGPPANSHWLVHNIDMKTSVSAW